jgi:hypothetical protein
MSIRHGVRTFTFGPRAARGRQREEEGHDCSWGYFVRVRESRGILSARLGVRAFRGLELSSSGRLESRLREGVGLISTCGGASSFELSSRSMCIERLLVALGPVVTAAAAPQKARLSPSVEH